MLCERLDLDGLRSKVKHRNDERPYPTHWSGPSQSPANVPPTKDNNNGSCFLGNGGWELNSALRQEKSYSLKDNSLVER